MYLHKSFIIILLLLCSCGITIQTTPTPSVFIPLVYSNESSMPRVFDEQGNEQSWAWLRETFGDVNIIRSVGGARIVALYAVTGPATLVAYVRDSAGQPIQGLTVVRYWLGAPDELPADLWGCDHTTGVYGETKEDGSVGFGMGYGDYYTPPAGGASSIWIAGGDCVTGLGMLSLSEHRHLDMLFVIP